MEGIYFRARNFKNFSQSFVGSSASRSLACFRVWFSLLFFLFSFLSIFEVWFLWWGLRRGGGRIGGGGVEDEAEGGAEDGTRCLVRVAALEEVDHELGGDPDDGYDDDLGELGDGVVNEDALEEASEEEIGSGGGVCWVGGDCIEEDASAEGEKERETSGELHKVRTVVQT